ncbi:hypothetical protein LOZ37_006824 [Ophidiomyces ophidiicola]|nr:hypothetical protein LOZ37_006824 [Ophidiomyces ophidiicola]
MALTSLQLSSQTPKQDFAIASESKKSEIPLLSKFNKMTNKAAIKLVIEDLCSQKTSNYAKTVKKYKINVTTLMCCFKDIQVSRCKVISLYSRNLTDVQKEALLEHIDTLMNHEFSATSQLLQNLANEIL